jgi:hypothetical protein
VLQVLRLLRDHHKRLRLLRLLRDHQKRLLLRLRLLLLLRLLRLLRLRDHHKRLLWMRDHHERQLRLRDPQKRLLLRLHPVPMLKSKSSNSSSCTGLRFMAVVERHPDSYMPNGSRMTAPS